MLDGDGVDGENLIGMPLTVSAEVVPAPGPCPVTLYAASLDSPRSRVVLVDSMRRVARALGMTHHLDAWRAIPWARVGPTETTAMRAMLLAKYAPATAEVTMQMLRGVLKQAWRAGLMPSEQYQRAIDLPPIPRMREMVVGRMLSPAEVGQLRAHLGKRGDARVTALFAAALGAGLRRDELVKLGVDALSEDGKSLRVSGKGKQVRVMPLPSWATQALQAWAAERAPDAETFFDGLRDGDVWSIITGEGAAAGLRRFTPHDLRRTYASTLLSTTDVGTVQKLMGHAQATTTLVYDRRPAETAERAVGALDAVWTQKVLYTRHGKPLDVEWVRRQVSAMRDAKWNAPRILNALEAGGVRRSDGAALGIEEVRGWSV